MRLEQWFVLGPVAAALDAAGQPTPDDEDETDQRRHDDLDGQVEKYEIRRQSRLVSRSTTARQSIAYPINDAYLLFKPVAPMQKETNMTVI